MDDMIYSHFSEQEIIMTTIYRSGKRNTRITEQYNYRTGKRKIRITEQYNNKEKIEKKYITYPTRVSTNQLLSVFNLHDDKSPRKEKNMTSD